jgi:hypothetical protein
MEEEYEDGGFRRRLLRGEESTRMGTLAAVFGLRDA